MMTTQSPPPDSNAALARVATGIEEGSNKIMAGFAAESASRIKERKITIAVLAVGFAAVLSAQWWLVNKSRTNAERIAALAAAIAAVSADTRETKVAAKETQARVEDVRAEAEAAPRLEVSPPAKSGGPPQVKLVVPARPATPARDATSTAPSASATAAAPALSIPIPLPSAAVSVGAGP